jgi:hypothetical protein
MKKHNKVPKQYKAMGFGDRDERGSVEAHLRAKEHAREMRLFNATMKKLDANDARKRSGLFSRVVRFFSSKYWSR